MTDPLCGVWRTNEQRSVRNGWASHPIFNLRWDCSKQRNPAAIFYPFTKRGLGCDSDGVGHGFVKSRNSLRTVDIPGADSTTLYSVNEEAVAR